MTDGGGLENTYPWDNTVELKENADALIKMVKVYLHLEKRIGIYYLAT